MDSQFENDAPWGDCNKCGTAGDVNPETGVCEYCGCADPEAQYPEAVWVVGVNPFAKPASCDSNRDPRKDPRKGDQLRDETGRLMVVDACYSLPQRPKQWQVSYTAQPGGVGCVCGLSNWRRYYKRAEVLHVAADPVSAN